MKPAANLKTYVVMAALGLLVGAVWAQPASFDEYSALLNKALDNLQRGTPRPIMRFPPLLRHPRGHGGGWLMQPPEFRPLVEGLTDANAVPFLIHVIYEGPSSLNHIDPCNIDRFRHKARCYAILSLATSGEPAAPPVLLDILESDPNTLGQQINGRVPVEHDLRKYAAAGLGILKDPNAVEPLVRMLQDENSYVKYHCFWSLARIGDLRAIEPMLKAAVADKEIDGLTLHYCLNKMTKAMPDFPELEPIKRGTSRYKKMWAHWFDIRETWTQQQFQERYDRWMEWKTERNYYGMQKVGIPALPLIIEKVNQGEKRLIPLFSRLVARQLPEDAAPQQVVTWWEKNKDRWTIPYEKLTPTLDANQPAPVEANEPSSPDPNQ